MRISSPVSDESMQQGCSTLRRHIKLGGKRIPAELRGALDDLLTRMESAIESSDDDLRVRIQLLREFEDLDDRLRGRATMAPQLYSNGMLGVIRAWEPIRIRECVDYRWISEHTVRYEERAQRALERLQWFLERCGLVEEEEVDLKPWQLPYAHLDSAKELLWGRIRRTT